MRVRKPQDTPSGTRMMWKARVNAIWERAHGTGSTVASAATASIAVLTSATESGAPLVRASAVPSDGGVVEGERRLHPSTRDDSSSLADTPPWDLTPRG